MKRPPLPSPPAGAVVWTFPQHVAARAEKRGGLPLASLPIGSGLASHLGLRFWFTSADIVVGVNPLYAGSLRLTTRLYQQTGDVAAPVRGALAAVRAIQPGLDVTDWTAQTARAWIEKQAKKYGWGSARTPRADASSG